MGRQQGQTIIREVNLFKEYKKKLLLLFYQLAKKSDVLIENYLPGQLKKFGLEYKDLQLINDRLIYCSITGFNEKFIFI